MFFAGRDTTKETISFLFWHLARNPDIMKRLRQEIAQDIGDHGDPSWEQLRNLKLLNWSIKETLRLHPVLPTASRTAVRDTVLPVGAGSDGSEPVFCPKGTDVRWLSWSTQRDARYYGPDPDEFRPDRWDGLRLTWEYIPFSGGPSKSIPPPPPPTLTQRPSRRRTQRPLVRSLLTECVLRGRNLHRSAICSHTDRACDSAALAAIRQHRGGR